MFIIFLINQLLISLNNIIRSIFHTCEKLAALVGSSFKLPELLDVVNAGMDVDVATVLNFIGSNGLKLKLAANRGIEMFHFGPKSCTKN